MNAAPVCWNASLYFAQYFQLYLQVPVNYFILEGANSKLQEDFNVYRNELCFAENTGTVTVKYENPL
jgi:hypothetical protein